MSEQFVVLCIMATWIGGGEGLYDDPIAQWRGMSRSAWQAVNQEDVASKMQPRCLLEVGMYDRKGQPKGIAVIYLVKWLVVKKHGGDGKSGHYFDGDGHYGMAFDLAVSEKHRSFVHGHSKKEDRPATRGPGDLYHFCTCKREQCRTLTHTGLKFPCGNGMTWTREPVVHVDVYRHINGVSEATPQTQQWLHCWHDVVGRRLALLAQRNIQLPRAIHSPYTAFPNCVTKNEKYLEWLDDDLDKLDIDPYFAYTDDHVQQHREHLRCVSVHRRNEGVRQRRWAKIDEEEEFVLHGSTCCRCGRPPANEDNNMFWCLLCTKPTGDQDADDAGTVAFGAPPEEAAEDQGVTFLLQP